MALFTGNVFSRSMQMETQVNVSVPYDRRVYARMPEPETSKTLILLHGISGNAFDWLRYSQAEMWADYYGITIATVDVQRSFYQNMKEGLPYLKWVAEELPDFLSKTFNTSTKREDLMVAGLSMGGYGAMRVAFGYPEKFSICGCFSSAFDVEEMIKNYKELEGQGEIGYNMEAEYTGIFGPGMKVPDDSNLFKLTEKVNKGAYKPKLYISSGLDDFIHAQSLKMRDHLHKIGYDFTYEEWPGIHDWIFWNESLKRFLGTFMKPIQPII
jgi:S-formylglutathione hydrolase FrmB